MTAGGVGRIAARLATKGAHAVVAPGLESDHTDGLVRLVAIGTGPASAWDVVEDALVEIVWCTTATVRDAFDDPARTSTAVGAWRAARILHDPDGVGAALVHWANAFTWDRIHVECERYVAHVVADTAATIVELLTARAAGDRRSAAVLRVRAAERLTRAMAVHLRLVAAHETELRGLVASAMGPDWTRDLDIAVGAERGASDFAVLSLFGAAVARADRSLSPQQRAATTRAIELTEQAV